MNYAIEEMGYLAGFLAQLYVQEMGNSGASAQKAAHSENEDVGRQPKRLDHSTY